MAVRAAMLTDPLDQRWAVLREALEGCSAGIDVRPFRSEASYATHEQNEDAQHRPAAANGAPGATRGSARDRTAVAALLARLPLSAVFRLAAYRPDLVVAQDFGASALQAALYRSLSRRSRLLLCAAEPPRRVGLRERVILSRVDGVLADGDELAQAVAKLRFPASRIFQVSLPHGVDAFLECGLTRLGPEAHRLVYAGDLSPQSGAADLLIAVAAWAEQHPGRPVEIWWIGEGDLAGVLSAQPLPSTVVQRFLGRLDPPEAASAFGQCGLLVVPSSADDTPSRVPEAFAAGLPVLGSRRNRRVRQFVREDVNGWLFDPLQPADMVQALCRALDSSPEQLDEMREAARARVRPAISRSFAERFRSAVAAVLPDVVLDPEPQRAS